LRAFVQFGTGLITAGRRRRVVNEPLRWDYCRLRTARCQNAMLWRMEPSVHESKDAVNWTTEPHEAPPPPRIQSDTESPESCHRPRAGSGRQVSSADLSRSQGLLDSVRHPWRVASLTCRIRHYSKARKMPCSCPVALQRQAHLQDQHTLERSSRNSNRTFQFRMGLLRFFRT
jgi:hypothetical protein